MSGDVEDGGLASRMNEQEGNPPSTFPSGEPSRARALEFRKGLFLVEYGFSKDGYANKEKGGKLFPLTARPRDIGRFSVGLGVYLTSLQLFLLIVVFMALAVGVPLMVTNAIDDRFTESYYLNVEGQEQMVCHKPLSPPGFYMKFTLGSRCGGDIRDSWIACPAECNITNQGRPVDCSSIVFWRNADPGTVFCDPQKIAARGLHEPVPGVQLVILLIGQFFFLLWILLFKRTQAKAAEQINASVITVGDYSVMVQNLKLDSLDNDYLIEFARHYGEVANAAHIATVGKPIELGLTLEKRRNTLEELKVQAENPRRYNCCVGIVSGLYWGLTGGFKYGNKAVDAAAAGVRSLEEQLVDAQKEALLPTGKAIITFNYEAHAKNMIRDHVAGKRNLRTFLSSLLERVACNMYFASTGPRLRGKRVKVTRAPEPTDIMWENTWVSSAERWKRRLIANTIIVVVVGLGAFIQFQLGEETQNSQDPKFGEQSAFDQLMLRLVPVLIGVVVVIVNLAISIVVQVLSLYESWFTRSDLEKWLTVKISTFYLVNSFLVPFLLSFRMDEAWYLKGGLVEQALYIQLSNAILPSLITLFDPMDLVKAQIFSRFARTQAMMDSLVMPHQFYLSERYAAAVKTVGLAMFYMPALPVSPFIGALGLIVSYMADKYVALRKTQKPHNLAPKVTLAINRLVLLLPLIQMILMDQLYFADHEWHKPIFWSGLGLWLAFALVPYTSLMGWDVASYFSDWGTEGDSFVKTIGVHARCTLPAASLDMMEAVAPNMKRTEGRGASVPEVYVPECPMECSPAFQKKVLDHFQLPPHPYPANPVLLQGQSKHTGGEHTAPPKPKTVVQAQGDPSPDQLPAVKLHSSTTGDLMGIPEDGYPDVPFENAGPDVSAPAVPRLERKGSLPGIPYDLQAAIMQQAPQASSSDQGTAYPTIYFGGQQRQTSFKPYYPVIFHNKD